MGFGGDGVGDHNKFQLLRWRHDTADVTDAYNGYRSKAALVFMTGSTALTNDRTVGRCKCYNRLYSFRW